MYRPGSLGEKQGLRILRPQLLQIEHPLRTILQLTGMQQIPHPRTIGKQ